MDLGNAFEIVYSLAEENALDANSMECQTDGILLAQAKLQEEALKIVHDFVVNEGWLNE